MKPDSNRLQPRSCEVAGIFTESVLRPAQHHFDLLKSNISDGCTSSTSMFDEEVGEVPSIFRQGVTKMEIAQELMEAGANSLAQRVAADGLEK